MKRLKLENLEVASFEVTGTALPERGTVRAYQGTTGYTDCPDCGSSQAYTCTDRSECWTNTCHYTGEYYHTCGLTCGITCFYFNTCGYSCDAFNTCPGYPTCDPEVCP